MQDMSMGSMGAVAAAATPKSSGLSSTAKAPSGGRLSTVTKKKVLAIMIAANGFPSSGMPKMGLVTKGKATPPNRSAERGPVNAESAVGGAAGAAAARGTVRGATNPGTSGTTDRPKGFKVAPTTSRQMRGRTRK